jgi:oxygen-independent coproporphyrinogen III oxidase
MDISVLQKYNKPGPRYTSYPPATFFHEGVTAAEYKNMIVQSNQQEPRNISIYIHVPFCRQLCHFCGCNTSCFPEETTISRYFDALLKEIETVSAFLDTSRPLTQIHWGGGTPNSVNLHHIEKVMRRLLQIFKPTEKAEIAMECNPAWLELKHIDQLGAMGFNRLSLGIQDFNQNVLQIVNRKPSLHPVNELISRMKANRMQGVNIDLIYGLPGQTRESFQKTIEQAVAISPDRLVTFSYAHVPWVKSAQKILEEAGLPSTEEKLAMFEVAWNILTQNGYEAIGMDHYARPDDELAIAMKNGKLHRNFQGYCTLETTGQVYGFGASSISQLQGGYYQNAKDIDGYITRIEQTGLATEKGYEVTFEDSVRRAVINEIMCNGFLHFDEMAQNWNITSEKLKEIISFDPLRLKPYIDDHLVVYDGESVRLAENGFLVVRNIAMEFDPLLLQGKGLYSKTV